MVRQPRRAEDSPPQAFPCRIAVQQSHRRRCPCPATKLQNLQRLAAALVEMEAKVRTVDAPGGLSFSCDAEFLRKVELLNLMTRFEDLDISFRPSGTAGHEDLRRAAVHYELEGLLVPVASLAAIIRSKDFANREKDRVALPTLRALLERSKDSD